jgi:hypothetical protein
MRLKIQIKENGRNLIKNDQEANACMEDMQKVIKNTETTCQWKSDTMVPPKTKLTNESDEQN